MARPDARRGETAGGAAAISVAIAALGAALYGWISLGVLARADPPGFGMDIYDQAWLALVEGRLDLPARVLRFEGHYAPDGTGYLYHGLAPLLTRALAAPFVDIGAVSLAPVSIWLWAVVGTAFAHAAFLAAAGPAFAAAPGQARSRGAGTLWAGVLAATLWVGGPGLMLASNVALYHEPVAVAFGLVGISLWLWSRVWETGRVGPWVLAGLALCAALMVHARPHLAIALYAAMGLALAQALWQGGARAAGPALVALALLGAGGGSYLGLNAARFGGATTAHGSFAGEGVIYGTVFWGREDPDGTRAQSFRDHGRFNAARIPFNAPVYLAAPPQPLWGYFDWHSDLSARHRAATQDRVGFIRIEYPDAGTLWIWTGWTLAAALSLGAGGAAWRRWAGPAVAAAIAAGLIFAYPTITLRYRIDLWLALAPLAFLGLATLAPWLARRRAVSLGTAAVIALCAVGVSFNLRVAEVYRNGFLERPGGHFGVWSEARCRAIAAGRDFAPRQVDVICRPPLPPAGVTPRPESAP